MHCSGGAKSNSELLLKDDIWSHTSNNLRFGNASEIPVFNENSSSALDSLRAHCEGKEPARMVTIRANYYESETNATQYENIGKARAEAVKAELVSRGMDAGGIFTAGNLLDGNFKGDTMFNGIAVDIQQLKEGELTTLDESNLLQPRNVYFETGKNSLSVTAELNNYMANAKEYLASHPHKRLMCTGYTDNVGAPAMNETLSKERAQFVKNKLTERGFDAEQIDHQGKGPADPIADNSTDDGRAKNRRVEMRIQ